MDCIDIMLILDADQLGRRHPNPSRDPQHPTQLERDEAFIVAVPRSLAPQGQASGTLDLRARRGDQIHWRARALSANISHAILYRIETDAAQTGIASAAAVLERSLTLPVPDPSDPTRYRASATCGNPVWGCEIASLGLLRFGLMFYLVGQHDIEGHLGTTGYYRWDCTLQVTAPHTD